MAEQGAIGGFESGFPGNPTRSGYDPLQSWNHCAFAKLPVAAGAQALPILASARAARLTLRGTGSKSASDY